MLEEGENKEGGENDGGGDRIFKNFHSSEQVPLRMFFLLRH